MGANADMLLVSKYAPYYYLSSEVLVGSGTNASDLPYRECGNLETDLCSSTCPTPTTTTTTTPPPSSMSWLDSSRFSDDSDSSGSFGYSGSIGYSDSFGYSDESGSSDGSGSSS